MLTECRAGDRGHIDLTNRMVRKLNKSVYASDYSSIQAAIDAAFAAGIGDLFVPDGTWNITQTIFCKTGVDVRLAHNATIKAAADVDVIKLAPRGGISGGKIDAAGITKSAILIDGNLKFYLEPTIVSDIQITGTGTGIKFVASEQAGFDPYPYVFGVVVDRVGISGFGKGIWMTVAGTKATVNANTISNTYIEGCTYSVYMDGVGDELAIDGNLFANITVQPTAESVRALYCEGSQNMFSNLFVWDWLATGQQTAIELTGSRNVVITNRAPAYVLGSETNKVVTPDA